MYCVEQSAAIVQEVRQAVQEAVGPRAPCKVQRVRDMREVPTFF